MSGNIITASNLVVAGNIAIGGFLVQGTSISSGTVEVEYLNVSGSITISGYQIEVSGTTINFSGAELSGITICGNAIGGGNTWVSTAATNLDMATNIISNVTSICGNTNNLNIEGNANFNKQGQDASIFIHPDTEGAYINIGTADGNATRAGVGLTVSGNAVFTGGIIDLSGYQLEVSGTTINFSGADLTGITICGNPIGGGGGGWVGTATTDLNMANNSIYGALSICADGYIAVSNIKIEPSGTGLNLGSATSITLSGYRQPFIQYGESTLASGTADIVPTFPYADALYSIAIAPKEDNSGFYVDNILSNQFTVHAANSAGTESWAFAWTTFGSIEQPPLG